MEFSLKYLSYEKGFLANALEAVLFASGEPVETDKLASLFEITKNEVAIAASELAERLAAQGSSFELILLDSSYQLCTRAAYGDIVQKFLEIKRTAPLSKAAMEALAIVAYKQPVTKTYIEQVRGVDCSGIVNTLIQRELIRECGRLDAPGRPILYETTPDFLRCFGLSSLKELPGENFVQLDLTEAEETDSAGSGEPEPEKI